LVPVYAYLFVNANGSAIANELIGCPYNGPPEVCTAKAKDLSASPSPKTIPYERQVDEHASLVVVCKLSDAPFVPSYSVGFTPR
jgi:hypothetical protein